MPRVHILVENKLAAAMGDGFDLVREAAIADASTLLGRASIDLGQSPNEFGLADLPTNQRVKNARSGGDDVELVTLTWDLGRHMLVGSSRNTAAAVDFPPALTTNLLETQEPLYDLMALAKPRGQQLAQACGRNLLSTHTYQPRPILRRLAMCATKTPNGEVNRFWADDTLTVAVTVTVTVEGKSPVPEVGVDGVSRKNPAPVQYAS
ncbi:hypothetical protein FHL15_002956 [Xylaria flabelliformis]|uniref:Glycosyl hydrolase family 95 catalytic domain-containing protein n=1 Tax=Xylaria flabelliformis TaxID=2512241 RepID=A0A553I7Q4_9PEZI|nr:hypothetical protein FHL15_002956 [Xylaria flabelliformis]